MNYQKIKSRQSFQVLNIPELLPEQELAKTETLARKILYYLIYRKASPSSIVAFTFTEKAAESMKSRIHQRLLELDESDILRKFGEMYVGTIHGYCTRLLQDNYGLSNYSVLDENQHMAFVIREGYNFGLNKAEYNKYGSYLMKCKVFISTLSAYYSELLDENSLSPADEHFKTMLERYESALKRHHKLTFDTLITNSISKLKGNRSPISSLKYLIVDEFQDINKAQFVLIKELSKNMEVTIVGDPRQSIYQWRGGNPEFFDTFTKEFDDVKTYEITENRRSPKVIVEMSNRISKDFSGDKFSDMTWKRKEEGLVAKIRFENAEQEANEIADQIAILTKKDRIPYSNFSILLRSIRTSADPLINAFKDRNIPYIVGGKVGLFKRDEAQALGMFITWLSETGYWQTDIYGREKISGDILRKEGLARWKKAVRYVLNDADVQNNLDRWKKKVLESTPTDNYGYKDVLHELLNVLNFKKLNQNDALDAVIMANVGSFSNILGDFESSFRLGGSKRDFADELYNLCNFLNGYAVMSYDEQPYEENGLINAVNIMTIHQSKGLQWPIVFLPSLVNRRFPSKRMSKPEDIWMIDSRSISNKGYFENKESQLRLFYVAVTRAMNAVVLSHFNMHAKQSAHPSEYLYLVEDFCKSFENLKEMEMNRYASFLPENHDLIESFPVKEIIDYEMCPYHYRLSKKWGYIQGVNTFMGYGDALHHILQLTSKKIKDDGEDYETAFEEASKEFYLPYASQEFTQKLLKNVKKELLDYITKNGDFLNNVQETELRIEFPAKQATIVGKVDVILRSDQGLEVRDYKSSDTVMRKEHSELQIRLYAKGLKELGWKIVKGSVANLRSNELDVIDVSEPQLTGSMTKAESVIDNIRSRRFEPKPGMFCSMCEYRAICSRAAQSGVAK